MPELTERELAEWPQSDLEPLDACPLCHSRDSDTLYTQLTDRVYCSAPGVWKLVRCQQCGSAFLNPRPAEHSIGLAYAGEYCTHQAVAPEYVPRSLAARVRSAVRNGYLNARYGYHLAPSVPLGVVIFPFLPRFQCLADYWVRHLPYADAMQNAARLQKMSGAQNAAEGETASGLPRPHLLDVGCGNGEFLQHMNTLGWNAEGVEPDAAAAQQATEAGQRVFAGMLPDAAFPDNAFDAVTLNHVLEHLYDPLATLRECWRILRPGGWLWIATPNLESTGHRRFGRYWLHLDPPRHLLLFTPASLQTTVRESGFAEATLCRVPFQTAQAFRASRRVSTRDALVPPQPEIVPATSRESSRADWRAWRHPALSEEIILRARKPIAGE